jgi:hypothetical protein
MESLSDKIKQKIREALGTSPVNSIEEAKQKYGDNHWWDSTDPVEVAMYQVFEPLNLVDSDHLSLYKEGLKKLTGEDVLFSEIVFRSGNLQKKVLEGVRNLGESEVVNRFNEYIQKTGAEKRLSQY